MWGKKNSSPLFCVALHFGVNAKRNFHVEIIFFGLCIKQAKEDCLKQSIWESVKKTLFISKGYKYLFVGLHVPQKKTAFLLL